MPEVTKISQLAMALEAAEGTAETLAASDVREVFDPSLSWDVSMFERNPVRSHMGRKKSKVGTKALGFAYTEEFRGSGSASAAPDFFKDLQLAGFQLEAAKSITIGAISGGPFQHNETVTGGTSGATGRVVFDTADGAAALYVVPIAGTFQSGEVLTGGTSGATATSSAIPASLGVLARPSSARQIYSMGIGAISGGPFTGGERVTGGTSSAKGRVLFDTKNGASTLYLQVLSGTFQSGETLTGEDSGATATSSSTASLSELVCPAGTMAFYGGLTVHKVRGARSGVKFSFKAGEVPSAAFDAKGIYVSVVDGALFSSGLPSITNEGPVFLGSGVTVGSYQPVLDQIEIDMQNQVSAHASAAEASGMLPFLITDRQPQITLDPDVVAEATHPFVADWHGEVERAVDFSWGSSAGNRFRVLVPEVQPNEFSPGDRENIRTRQITGQINSSAVDQDLVILSY